MSVAQLAGFLGNLLRRRPNMADALTAALVSARRPLEEQETKWLCPVPQCEGENFMATNTCETCGEDLPRSKNFMLMLTWLVECEDGVLRRVEDVMEMDCTQ